ncbi:hypothetical protein FVR03_16100 [Pontibacter qinzhouensis]|uniref:Uncharacterized protein n=1 Tax=Pontibacter qinzhouensis TaxID=2603253 RepID=A0A5C8JK96_9BACT|nr:hypothetical protein [Pontibacter qinzhouensis]TXK37104.1 hypothetical protein FVR03_16100 [Pontibacter qinzhouensis]
MDHPVSIWPVLALVLIHFFGMRLRFLSGLPRSIWLSGAGGVSVAYVFLHLFPELNEGQEHIEDAVQALSFLRHHVYLMALLGLAVFYGLERSVVSSRKENQKDSSDEQASPGVFWVHIGSFALYNALIGYILFQREEGPVQEMLLFAIAMALHFIVNDFGLQDHHQHMYRRMGRWVLVTALLAGWLTGFLVEMPQSVIVLLMAFVGGGVVLNVLKEELPEERESRYWAFLVGATVYSVLLLAI